MSLSLFQHQVPPDLQALLKSLEPQCCRSKLHRIFFFAAEGITRLTTWTPYILKQIWRNWKFITFSLSWLCSRKYKRIVARSPVQIIKPIEPTQKKIWSRKHYGENAWCAGHYNILRTHKQSGNRNSLHAFSQLTHWYIFYKTLNCAADAIEKVVHQVKPRGRRDCSKRFVKLVWSVESWKSGQLLLLKINLSLCRRVCFDEFLLIHFFGCLELFWLHKSEAPSRHSDHSLGRSNALDRSPGYQLENNNVGCELVCAVFLSGEWAVLYQPDWCCGMFHDQTTLFFKKMSKEVWVCACTLGYNRCFPLDFTKTGTVKPALSDHLLLATDFSCTESLPFKTTCIRRPPA